MDISTRGFYSAGYDRPNIWEPMYKYIEDESILERLKPILDEENETIQDLFEQAAEGLYDYDAVQSERNSNEEAEPSLPPLPDDNDIKEEIAKINDKLRDAFNIEERVQILEGLVKYFDLRSLRYKTAPSTHDPWGVGDDDFFPDKNEVDEDYEDDEEENDLDDDYPNDHNELDEIAYSIKHNLHLHDRSDMEELPSTPVMPATLVEELLERVPNAPRPYVELLVEEGLLEDEFRKIYPNLPNDFIAILNGTPYGVDYLNDLKFYYDFINALADAASGDLSN